MSSESKFFTEKQAKSLNALQSNPNTWRIQPKSIMQMTNAVERLKMDLEEGILAKLRLQRQQQLLDVLSDKCYQSNDYTYAQAMMCQEFYEKNDFKLNLLDGFVRDHMTKHLQGYEQCYSGAAFESLPTNADKDREFLSCHKKWISNLKTNVAFDLETKARNLFQQTPQTQ